MSCVNGAEMWVWKKKKIIFVNRFIEFHLGQLRENKKKYNWTEVLL